MQTTGGVVTKKYLTIEEASEYLRMPIRTLRMKIEQGLVRCYKPGKRLLIETKDLDNYVKRHVKDHAS